MEQRLLQDSFLFSSYLPCMKTALQQIMDRINQLSSGDEVEVLRQYRNLVGEAVKLMEQGKDSLTGMAGIWCDMALKELQGELNQRMHESVFSQDAVKRKSELAYSRSLVTMALMNVIMNI